MSMRDRWTRLRFVLLVVSGALVGTLASRLLFPMVFERGGPAVFPALPVLLVGVLLLARAFRRERARV